MNDAWDELKKAKEEEYFMKQNQEALKRLKARKDSEEKPRLSPITGEPMEQLTMMGVVVDRCPTSHGIWLDAGELEQIIDFGKEDAAKGDNKGNAFTSFFSNLLND
jgi:hypothetical protein